MFQINFRALTSKSKSMNFSCAQIVFTDSLIWNMPTAKWYILTDMKSNFVHRPTYFRIVLCDDWLTFLLLGKVHVEWPLRMCQVNRGYHLVFHSHHITAKCFLWRIWHVPNLSIYFISLFTQYSNFWHNRNINCLQNIGNSLQILQFLHQCRYEAGNHCRISTLALRYNLWNEWEKRKLAQEFLLLLK